MDGVVRIPMFPLAILPLPGELVPLHIFEPRYRQLLRDLETQDISFGIFCTDEMNTLRVGSLMKLESIIKRYPSGESDIIVKCEDIITVDGLFKTFKDKLYPGGDVHYWAIDKSTAPDGSLTAAYDEYLALRNITRRGNPAGMYSIAHELNLDLNDRYRFLTTAEDVRQHFLINRVRFQIHVLRQEDKSKDVYHLN